MSTCTGVDVVSARKRPRRMRLTAGLIVLAVVGSATPLTAQDTPDYYRANCMNCHTIGGGRLAGPDLKGVTKRKDTEWLIEFMQNPRAVVERGDPYAAKLVEETPGGAIMPTPPGHDPLPCRADSQADRNRICSGEVSV